MIFGCGVEDPVFEPLTGSLQVRSAPDSLTANVLFQAPGDTFICAGTTPLFLELLEPGTYTLKLNRPGYLAVPESLLCAVAAGELLAAEFQLMPNWGSLVVTSLPEGAAIYVDDQDQGLNTPATVTGLPPGTHTVRVVLAGYTCIPESRPCEITAGGVATADFTLEPILGSLAVTSAPAGAAIFVDGEDQGLNTPGTVTGLELGEHLVTVLLEGYDPDPESRLVTIVADQIATAAFTMVPNVGSLLVTSTPGGAAISVDGLDQGLTTPATVTGLQPGDHEVTVDLDGQVPVPASRTVTIVAGQTATADFSFASPDKIVLLEGFSNVCCDGCPTMNETLHQLLTTAGYGPDRVLLVKWAVNYPLPTDPHYTANPADNDARAWGPGYDMSGYYADLLTGVPTLFGDGALLGGSGDPPDLTTLQSLVDGMLDGEPGFSIQVEATVTGATVDAAATLLAFEPVDVGNCSINFVLVQNPVEYAQPACPYGEQEYVFHWIMRDFDKDALAQAQLAAGTPVVLEADLASNLSWPCEDMYVIAFVQNDQTRQVLQAGSNISAKTQLLSRTTASLDTLSPLAPAGGQP